MTVKIGSARISENGTINGAKGDQTKNEVGTQDWYLHPKGWVVLRPKDPDVAEKIAYCMEGICSNDNFGYGQNDRDTSFNAMKAVDFEPERVKIKVNVDCSLAVLECLRRAGINITYNGENPFYTGNMIERIKKTGNFDVLASDEYCKKSDLLKRGDILVTKTKGHTAAVLTNGSKASGTLAGWVKSGSNKFYYAKGKKVIKDWIKDGGYWYRLGNSGEMLTGFHLVTDKTTGKARPCYFDAAGRLYHEAPDHQVYLEVWCDK